MASTGLTVLPEFLPPQLRQPDNADGESTVDLGIENEVEWEDLHRMVEAAFTRGETDIYRRLREQFDRLLILRAMQAAGGNQNRAAELLGLSRVTLRARLRSLQLAVEKRLAPHTPADDSPG